MEDSQVVESSSGSPAISVVVTTIPTSTSQTTCVDPSTSEAARHRFSQIKLVGVGGLERQNYCCNHWFPSSKSYHRHLAEKALSDASHEAKLLDLGMVRCAHCSVWVHTENIIAHLAKGHSNNKEGKASKMVSMGTITEVPRLSGESMLSGTNIVIKVTGQNTPKSFSSNISKTNANSLSKSGTVKLVTTSSSSLYQKMHNMKHSDSNGTDKVIVRKSVTNTLPMVNVGPRLVMKSLGQAGVGPLGRGHKMVQQVSQPSLSSVTGVNGVTIATTYKMTKESHSAAAAVSRETPLKAMVPQSNFHNIAGRSLKLVKRVASEASKHKSVECLPSDSQNNLDLPHSTKTKEKKVLTSGDASSSKTHPGKKRRKQVLKPSTSDISYTETTTTPPPPSLSEGKAKKRGRKSKLLTSYEGGNCNPPPNHKGHRRKLKESLDHDSCTPKMARRPTKGIRGGWKKKRGPGRPRKNQLSETPDTSELDSLFDEIDREDLENEPVVVAKKEEENIPTVELDLFTLPSTNEQVSVLLTEPQNPNFKVYASMDAIFVGDSALGDVTNQIGYVTDANNVVYVNPSHFLFPNVEDLENFVPSPILTMKGNKVGLTPVRKPWNVGSNKAYAPIVLKQVGVNASKDTISSDASLEKNHEEKESPVHVTKPRVEEHILKNTQSSNSVLVMQERVNTKKEPKPTQASSCKPEVPEVVKEPQNSAMEMVSPYTKVNKTRSHKKKKKRRKSDMKSSSEEKIKNSSFCSDNSNLLMESKSELKPVQVPPKCSTDLKTRHSVESKNKERQTANESLIQKCVVKLEELKYPLKFEKSTTVLPELLSNGVMAKGSEETTTDVISTLSTVKAAEESCLQEEIPTDSSVLKLSDTEAADLDITEEDLKPNVEEKYISSVEETLLGVMENAVPETIITETSSLCAPVTEVSKVVCRTVGGGLPRRMRRRRLRTKSANIVSSITESIQELGGDGGDSVCGDRRVRHVSENSVLLNKAEVSELKIMPVNNQSEWSGSGHSPKRKLEKVSVKTDAENPVDIRVLEQFAYPQTPHSSTDLSSCSSQEKTPNDNRENTLSISPPSGERKRVKKHKTKHEDKEKTAKIESPCVEILKPVDLFGSACSEQSSTESDREEKPVQVRSVRERRPSFKLLESLSVASHSPKRSPQSKLEEQLHSPSEHIPDNQGNKQPGEYTAVSSIMPDTSPSREWLGRGAKLKAQVLIQDQQAGVMDSHIYPPNDLPQQTSGKNSTTESSSPKLVLLSPSKTSSSVPASKSPSPTGSSKTCKPLVAVQNREWQARGAKLKAQVMISDPESSLVPYTSVEELPKPITSPPTKKIKLDLSPANTKDIRSFFKSGKSQVSEDNTTVVSSNSPISPRSPHATKTPKRHGKNGSDIRTYFSVTSPTTQAMKVKEENVGSSPKKLALSTSVSSENKLTCSNFEDMQPFVQPLPISEYTFEGFTRITRQSSLRSKSLLRLVSLFNVKRWHHLDRFTFPVDQLCDWDDELLSSYDFD